MIGNFDLFDRLFHWRPTNVDVPQRDPQLCHPLYPGVCVLPSHRNRQTLSAVDSQSCAQPSRTFEWPWGAAATTRSTAGWCRPGSWWPSAGFSAATPRSLPETLHPAHYPHNQHCSVFGATGDHSIPANLFPSCPTLPVWSELQYVVCGGSDWSLAVGLGFTRSATSVPAYFEVQLRLSYRKIPQGLCTYEELLLFFILFTVHTLSDNVGCGKVSIGVRRFLQLHSCLCSHNKLMLLFTYL